MITVEEAKKKDAVINVSEVAAVADLVIQITSLLSSHGTVRIRAYGDAIGTAITAAAFVQDRLMQGRIERITAWLDRVQEIDSQLNIIAAVEIIMHKPHS